MGHGKSTFAEALSKLEPNSAHFESSLIIAEVANAMHAALPKNPPSSFHIWHERTAENIPDPYNIEELNRWLESLPSILQERVHADVDSKLIKLDAKAIEEHPIEYQKLIMHVENLKRDPKLSNDQITRENKERYRPFLQWLGGYLVQKISRGIWYDEIVRRIQNDQNNGRALCIVGGLRFPSDAMILRDAGAQIFKVYRPGHLQNDMLDPTERERGDIAVDCTIASDGTVEDIQRAAGQILQDLKNNSLQTTYHTARFNS